jgi:hypothetical protein
LGSDSGAFVVLECCTLKVQAVLSEMSVNAAASEPSSGGVRYQIIRFAFWVAVDIYEYKFVLCGHRINAYEKKLLIKYLFLVPLLNKIYYM